eukprot:NODE_16040_length_1015_cov_5.922297.p1 GENE.NODE_16040_length_1015_cov_5.922297~~NODE_16040_length_1015_cov_5.922297.p1  ORF type:complete len:290 (-),score=97.24 NODE_16040_length_1015_cov_5.922297:62-931(-)
MFSSFSPTLKPSVIAARAQTYTPSAVAARALGQTFKAVNRLSGSSKTGVPSSSSSPPPPVEQVPEVTGRWAEAERTAETYLAQSARRRLSSRELAKGSAGPLAQVQQVQAELDQEREERHGRVLVLQTLDEAVRSLREEVTEERRLLVCAEDDRVELEARTEESERRLQELQADHHQLLGKRAQQDVELRRFAIAAAVAEREAKQAAQCGPDAWARDGPETEALKQAKMRLAEVLTFLDEARLESKKEFDVLQRDVEAEATVLRQRQRDSTLATQSSVASTFLRMLTGK